MFLILAEPPLPPPTVPQPTTNPHQSDGASLDDSDGGSLARPTGGSFIDDDPDVIGTDVSNGACGLLYSSYQLHTSMRKILQVYLLKVG